MRVICLRASLRGADSGIYDMANSGIATAPVRYQAGASALPVRSVSQATANWAVPPNTEMARA